MSDTRNGTAKNLSDSRKQALQALVSSLAPDGSPEEKGLSEEQVEALSDRLNHILGSGEEGPEVRRNEKGEVLNEEGLPVVDISEPLNDVSGSVQVPEAFLSVYDPPPLSSLSEKERAQLRIRRDRILDILEEEERRHSEWELEREKKRRMEEVARMDSESKAAARKMQKKMGKALLQNLAAQREKEEQERREAEEAASSAEVSSPKGDASVRKPKKKVSFANVPEVDEEKPKPPVAWGDVSVAKLKAGVPKARLKAEAVTSQPMKLQVVERTPGVVQAPLDERDSDDESNPDTQNVETDEVAEENTSLVDNDSSGDWNMKRSDDSDSDEFDFSQATIQREVALEYIRLREKVGADARRAMTPHSHDPDNEWDQPKVPLEASLISKAPKAGVSRFKAERQVNAHASGDASVSLGAAVLPENKLPILQKSVRTGKLVNGQLIGGDASDSDIEDDERENVNRMMEALKNGVVLNNESDPSTSSTTRDDTTKASERNLTSAPPVLHTSKACPPESTPRKPLRFKAERGARGEEPPGVMTSPSNPAASTSAPVSAVVRERPSPVRSVPPDSAESGGSVNVGSQPNAAFKKPPTVISPPPSILPEGRRPFAKPQVLPDPTILTNMIVESPSFPPPPNNTGARTRPGQTPSPVVSEVRESTRRAGMSSEEPTIKTQRTGKVSRFKAERTRGTM